MIPSNRARILDIVGRFLHLHLTPLGASRRRARVPATQDSRAGLFWIFGYWLPPRLSRYPSSAGTFHEFHQLPFHPPLALFFGLGMQPLFALGTVAPRAATPAHRRHTGRDDVRGLVRRGDLVFRRKLGVPVVPPRQPQHSL